MMWGFNAPNAVALIALYWLRHSYRTSFLEAWQIRVRELSAVHVHGTELRAAM
jgi:hypothetical protein